MVTAHLASGRIDGSGVQIWTRLSVHCWIWQSLLCFLHPCLDHSTPNYSKPNRLLYYLGPGCVNHYPAQFPVDVELLLVPVLGAYFTRREFKYIHSTFDFRRLILLSLSLIAGIRAYRIYRSHLHIALHPESIGSLADQSTFFAWTCLMASW